MKMKRRRIPDMKYIEIGLGNEHFVSTEIEQDDQELRVKGIGRISKVSNLP